MNGEAEGRTGGRDERDGRHDPEARGPLTPRDEPEGEGYAARGGFGPDAGFGPDDAGPGPHGDGFDLDCGGFAADGGGSGLDRDAPPLGAGAARPGGDAPGLEVVMHAARALVLADLAARGVAEADVVSLLEDAVSKRRWWLRQWPDGAAYIPGLLAQDVQDALLETYGRWPLCPHCDEPHALAVEPELGEDPHWVCEARAEAVAPVGSLGA